MDILAQKDGKESWNGNNAESIWYLTFFDGDEGIQKAELFADLLSWLVISH